MADSRYNVDDILREVKAKKERSAHPDAAPIPPAAPNSIPQEEPRCPSSSSSPAPQEPAANAPGKASSEEGEPKHPAPVPAPGKSEPPPAPAAEPELFETNFSEDWEEQRPAPAPVGEPEPAPREPSGEAHPAGKGIAQVKIHKETSGFSASQARAMVEPVLEALEKKGRRLTVTLIIQCVAFLAVLYLALASTLHLLLPDFLATNGASRIWGMVAITVVSALSAGGTIGNGFLSIFTARRSNDAYVTLTVFACLLQGSFLATCPDLLETLSGNLYLPLAAAILLFHTVGKLIDNGRKKRNCETVAHEPPMELRLLGPSERLTQWASSLPEQPENVLRVNRAASMNGLEGEFASPAPTENLAGVLAPIAAAAALIMAVASYFMGDGGLYTAATIFTAALCITSPFAASIASAMPLARTNRGLTKAKTALLGGSAAQCLSEADSVLLSCAELFPSGSITLHGVKTFDKKPLDEAILNAASVLCGVDNTLTAVFRSMIDTTEILKPVESITSEEGLGISAWVDGGRVLIGNRHLLQQHGVQVPSQEAEDRLCAGGREILYLSNFGSLSAGFIISYRADRQISRQLKRLVKRGVALLLHSTDPNITSSLVARVYELPEECIHILPAGLHSETEDVLTEKVTVPAAMAAGSPAGALRALYSASRCMGITRAISFLLVLSVLLGFALVTLLAFVGAVGRLTWINIGIYQIFWLLVLTLVGLPKN